MVTTRGQLLNYDEFMRLTQSFYAQLQVVQRLSEAGIKKDFDTTLAWTKFHELDRMLYDEMQSYDLVKRLEVAEMEREQIKLRNGVR